MFEQELIEKLNDIDNRWRDKFDDVWTAADYHGLIDLSERLRYEELDFN